MTLLTLIPAPSTNLAFMAMGRNKCKECKKPTRRTTGDKENTVKVHQYPNNHHHWRVFVKPCFCIEFYDKPQRVRVWLLPEFPNPGAAEPTHLLTPWIEAQRGRKKWTIADVMNAGRELEAMA